jgi:hypothetical protein
VPAIATTTARATADCGKYHALESRLHGIAVKKFVKK